eukprot:TRINITY_DN14089_c0_g1_i1.p1 TRINITY_DN14089_c0_g1~~TRINITY_DN14089_c0_g1_i1.p1  ORF type:complete len:308 (-),score=40.76 TRINITY_DN14089_c0_g1_i1:17-940(-)
MVSNTTAPGVPAGFRSGVTTGLAIIGLCSLVGSLMMTFLIVHKKLYTKLRTRLVLYLSLSDFSQSLASVAGFAYISQAPTVSPNCTFQAVMFVYGCNAAGFASAIIATFVLVTMTGLGKRTVGRPGKKFEICSVILIFFVPAVFVFIGFMRGYSTGLNFYVPVGFASWCWISISFPIERMMLEFTWLILISLYMFISYMYVGTILFQTRKFPPSEELAKKRKKLVLTMIGYPIIFFGVFIFIGIQRLVESTSSIHGNTPYSFPIGYSAFAVIMLGSDGFWNALYYGYSRKLFQFRKANKLPSNQPSS